MSGGVAKFLKEKLVDRTLNDCRKKCDPSSGGCAHRLRGSLQVAHFLEAQLTFTTKRGYLDVPCPFLTTKDDEQAARYLNVLEDLVIRIRDFAGMASTLRTINAVREVAREVDEYRQRNPMEVIAEAAD